MAIRRTYEQKLLDDLRALPSNKWFKITDRDDYKKFVAQVKVFIDRSEDFELSDDYKRLRRLSEFTAVEPWHTMKKLPEGIFIEHIPKGTPCEVNHRGTTYQLEHSNHYRIFKNGVLIAIEG